MFQNYSKTIAVCCFLLLYCCVYALEQETTKENLKEASHNADAQYQLAYRYFRGENIKRDWNLARYWFEKAALQGHALAQYDLGVMYGKGEGVDINYKIAFFWIEKAALQACPQAEFCLGIMYYDGLGVEKDKEKAKEWFMKAFLQGEEKANDFLTILAQEDKTSNNLKESSLKISYREVFRGYTSQYGPLVAIQPIVKGFPAKTPLKFKIKRLDRSVIEYHDEYIVNEKNQLVINDRVLQVNLSSFAKGEPIICFVSTKDGQTEANFGFVPFPIKTIDKKGRSLSIELASPDGMGFLVLLSGFKPFEKAKFWKKLSGFKPLEEGGFWKKLIQKENREIIQVGEDGNYYIIMKLNSLEKQTGKASLFVQPSNSKPLKVDFQYGIKALEPYK